GADPGNSREAGAQSRSGRRHLRGQGRALRGGAGGDGHAPDEQREESGTFREAASAVMYEDEATPREKKLSRNLAIGVHVAIVVLLIFGVSWHRRQAAEPSNVADLWSSMNPPREQAPKPEPPLKIAPKIEKEP